MSAWDIYFVMQFHVIGALSGLVGIMMICAGVIYAIWASDHVQSKDEPIAYRRAKWISIVGGMLLFLGLLWPDRKTFIAMYFGPKIHAYIASRDISEEARECFTIAKRVLLEAEGKE